MFEHLAQPVGNRQAQAQAFLGAGLVAVEALEFLENHQAFVFGDARAAVPDLQTQPVALAAHAQQHTTLGIAEGIGEEVLQHPAEHLAVAVDPRPAAAQAKIHALLLGQCGEFAAQGVEQAGQREGLAVGLHAAAFETGNIQQVADQVFGRTQ